MVTASRLAMAHPSQHQIVTATQKEVGEGCMTMQRCLPTSKHKGL